MGLTQHNGNLLGRNLEELEKLAVSCGQPRYRGRQLYHGIYVRRVRDLCGLTDLNRDFRDAIAAQQGIIYPQVEREFSSRDGAVRYLFRLADGNQVETVYMPEEDRTTLCLSSQVGCALDCKFCFTALLGAKRNLNAGEIIGQVLAVAAGQNVARGARLNLVFMGMGEPLLNLVQVLKAVGILADPKGMGLPLRRITVSTVGILPRIEELALHPMRPKLAISLNASHDEQRSALMPINRNYPLADLLRVCRAYPLRPWEHLMFEYVLLDGFNDADDDARRVADLLRDLRAKVNLIPYNSGPELPFRTPRFERVLAFQKILMDRRIPTFIRISRGQDISAACGQLSLAIR
ncbi:MAG TPA: 23S rRNA (adenine(2503)-C(2))-methyltransferase RlmN [Terriglobia bacterium]|nr:23S rRNA (adenine(2503)-C(2))-methyltransferase RlmN [Terriglobia bacterium]